MKEGYMYIHRHCRKHNWKGAESPLTWKVTVFPSWWCIFTSHLFLSPVISFWSVTGRMTRVPLATVGFGPERKVRRVLFPVIFHDTS